MGDTSIIARRLKDGHVQYGWSGNGGCHWFETHDLKGEPFWLGRTERCVFSKMMFIDYGYFYDLDNKWYYIIPGPFRIKMPLELIAQHLNEDGYEFDFLREVEDKILKYIFNEYIEVDTEFADYIEKEGYQSNEIIQNINKNGRLSVMKFYDKYKKVWDYFDDWILVKTNGDNTEITDIIIRKKVEKHIETCEW